MKRLQLKTLNSNIIIDNSIKNNNSNKKTYDDNCSQSKLYKYLK